MIARVRNVNSSPIERFNVEIGGIASMSLKSHLSFHDDLFGEFLAQAEENFPNSYHNWHGTMSVLNIHARLLCWRFHGKAVAKKIAYEIFALQAEKNFQMGNHSQSAVFFHQMIQAFTGDSSVDEERLLTLACARFFELNLTEEAHTFFATLRLSQDFRLREKSAISRCQMDRQMFRHLACGDDSILVQLNLFDKKLFATIQLKNWDHFFVFCNMEFAEFDSDQLLLSSALNLYGQLAGYTALPLKTQFHQRNNDLNSHNKTAKILKKVKAFYLGRSDKKKSHQIAQLFAEVDEFISNPFLRMTVLASLTIMFGRNNQTVLYHMTENLYGKASSNLTLGRTRNFLNLIPFNHEFGVSGLVGQKIKDFFNRTSGFKISRQYHFAKFLAESGTKFISLRLKMAFVSKATKKQLEQNLAFNILGHANKLKGVSVKFLQILSFCGDAVPDSLKNIFRNAQAGATMLKQSEIRKILVQEMVAQEVVESLSPEPLGQASIGQVHSALIGSVPVAIKIQYPDAVENITADLDLLRLFIPFLKFIFADDNVERVYCYLAKKIIEECDYRLESNYQIFVFTALHKNPIQGVIVPAVYSASCSKKVLVTELAKGKDFYWFKLNATQSEKNSSANKILEFILHMLFSENFLYCDMHPGNFLFTEESVSVVDFGHCQHFTVEQTECVRILFKSFLNDDLALFKQGMVTLGDYPEDTRFDFEKEFLNLKSTTFKPFTTEMPFKFCREFATSAAHQSFLGSPNLADGRIVAEFSSIVRIFYGLYFMLAELEAEICVRQIVAQKVLTQSAVL